MGDRRGIGEAKASLMRGRRGIKRIWSILRRGSEELMERFVRGDRSRHTEGSGLGLSIAKSLTELQKGDFELMVDGDFFKVTISFPII